MTRAGAGVVLVGVLAATFGLTACGPGGPLVPPEGPDISPLPDVLPDEAAPDICASGERPTYSDGRWSCVGGDRLPLRSRFGMASRVWIVPTQSSGEAGLRECSWPCRPSFVANSQSTIVRIVVPGRVGGTVSMLGWSDETLVLDAPLSGSISVAGTGTLNLTTEFSGTAFYGWTVLVSDVPILVWGAQVEPKRWLEEEFVSYATAPVAVECSDPDEFVAFEMACIIYETAAR
jgi:hypothetical protein